MKVYKPYKAGTSLAEKLLFVLVYAIVAALFLYAIFF